MKSKLTPIKAFAKVLPGLPMKGASEHDPEGTHQIILPRHLPDDGPYRYREEHCLRTLPKRPVDRYMVAQGDILFTPRGVYNTAILAEHVHEPSVAHGSLFIIRVKKSLALPGYLVWCLSQSRMQAKLAEMRTGTSMPMVSRKALEELNIPLPPLKDQESIARLDGLAAREREIVRDLLGLRESIHAQIGRDIMKTLTRNTLIKD